MIIASHIKEDEKNLVALAKKLKKNEIAVDIVSIGYYIKTSPEENLSRIEAFIGAINKDDNSHYVHLPPGPSPIGEQLLGNPIMGGQ
jgi:26S proteasome regulatory subunit N10